MENLIISLKQHVGAPCIPLVKVGETVERGQQIGEPNGLGANIYASVNGEVISVNENEVTIAAASIKATDFKLLPETDSHLKAVELAGIVGAGGAGFPTHIKLAAKLENGFIIANAAECEPILGHNVRQMETQPKSIVQGLKYAMEITTATQAYIAIKPHYTSAIAALKQAINDDPRIELKFLPDMYPSGDERVVIREILGIELEPGELPSKANAVVLNVETLKRITEAIELRKPFIDKDLTVSGRVAKGTKVFENQPIGLTAKHFIDEMGGYIQPYGEIVVGGPFTGRSGSEESLLTKTTGSFIVAMCYPQEKRKAGLLICECGAHEERLREIADNMGATVVSTQMCKRMVEVNGRFRCSLPGVCPGQAESILGMKKEGAEVVIAGSCQD